MAARRNLKNDNETEDLFNRPKVFHNTKNGDVIMLFGVTADGNYYGARLNFTDTYISTDNTAAFTPDAFWKLAGTEEVREIDVLELPGFTVETIEKL